MCPARVAGGHDARVVSRVDPCRYCPGNGGRSTTFAGCEGPQEKESYFKTVFLVLLCVWEGDGDEYNS